MLMAVADPDHLETSATISPDLVSIGKTEPSLSEFYAGAAAAYGISAGTLATVLPPGWHVLLMSTALQPADGFAAVAVQDPTTT